MSKKMNKTGPYYIFPEKQSEGKTEKRIEISEDLKSLNREFTKAYLSVKTGRYPFRENNDIRSLVFVM